MRDLTDQELEVWQNITKSVKPLDSSSEFKFEQPSLTVDVNPVSSSPVLDLHGLTVHDAYQQSMNHISMAKSKGWRYVTIITGLSGQINIEFPRWFSNHPMVRSIEHKRGGGAWEIWLKKNI